MLTKNIKTAHMNMPNSLILSCSIWYFDRITTKNHAPLFHVWDNWSVNVWQFKSLKCLVYSWYNFSTSSHQTYFTITYSLLDGSCQYLDEMSDDLEHVVLRFSGENANNHFLKRIISQLLNLLKTLQEVIHFRLSILSIGSVYNVHQGMQFACANNLSVN